MKNIKFRFQEGAIKFSYEGNNQECIAYLQLPDTGDSVHIINGIEEEGWPDTEKEIFKELEEFYFNSFADTECAAASAKLGKIIIKVDELFYKNEYFYIALDKEGNKNILVESQYKNYYNKKALFELFEHSASSSEFSEEEILKEYEDNN